MKPIKHFGDITKLNGADLPIVDVITGGSPCQDLSVAGKRAGLDGERSGLFMEQVRIVKEMREHDRQLHSGRTDVNYGLRPRYMVWENVPGSFSSNAGADFQIVLTEIARIADSDCPDVPMPNKGKWSKSGCIYDEMGRWSIAWRVHDAQFWGVPQRRKRISLIADFGGLSAPEILFERKGLRWDFGEGKEKKQNHSNSAGRSAVASNIIVENERMTYRKKGHPTSKNDGQGWEEASVADTLNGFDVGETRTPILIYEAHAQDCRYKLLPNVCETISAKYKSPCGNAPLAIQNGAVRYLTPMECERLQGFPDGWTDIGEWIDTKGKKRKPSDSNRYKSLGNSLALPFWKYVARKICSQYERSVTIGSLFDGIGGFPLAFQESGAKTVWCSEVDEFCIALTKKRFGDG